MNGPYVSKMFLCFFGSQNMVNTVLQIHILFMYLYFVLFIFILEFLLFFQFVIYECVVFSIQSFHYSNLNRDLCHTLERWKNVNILPPKHLFFWQSFKSH